MSLIGAIWGEAGALAQALWIAIILLALALFFFAGRWLVRVVRPKSWERIRKALGPVEDGRDRWWERLAREISGWKAGGVVGDQEAVLSAFAQHFHPIRRAANILVLLGLAGTVVGLLGIALDLEEAFRDAGGPGGGVGEAALADAMDNLLVAFTSTLLGAVGALIARSPLILAEWRVRVQAAEFGAGSGGLEGVYRQLGESAESLRAASTGLERLVGGSSEEDVAQLEEITTSLKGAVDLFQGGAERARAELQTLFEELADERRRAQGELEAMLERASERQEESLERASRRQEGMLARASRLQQELLEGAAGSMSASFEGLLRASDERELRVAESQRAQLESIGERVEAGNELLKGAVAHASALGEQSRSMSEASSKLAEAADRWHSEMLEEHRGALAGAAKELGAAFTGAEERAVESWKAAAVRLEGIENGIEAMIAKITDQSESSASAAGRLREIAEETKAVVGELQRSVDALGRSLEHVSDRAELMAKGVSDVGELLRREDERGS